MKRRSKVFDQFVEVHASLPRLLMTLCEEEDLVGLQQQLGALRLLLNEHFREEERVGGFFDELSVQDPAKAEPLRALEEQHAGILSNLDELIETIRLFHRQISTSKLKLISLIHRHQRAEDDLVGEIYGIATGTLSP